MPIKAQFFFSLLIYRALKRQTSWGKFDRPAAQLSTRIEPLAYSKRKHTRKKEGNRQKKKKKKKKKKKEKKRGESHSPCFCITRKNLTITLELGRIRTWRLPDFSALLMAFSASLRTDVLTMFANSGRRVGCGSCLSFPVFSRFSNRGPET